MGAAGAATSESSPSILLCTGRSDRCLRHTPRQVQAGDQDSSCLPDVTHSPLAEQRGWHCHSVGSGLMVDPCLWSVTHSPLRLAAGPATNSVGQGILPLCHISTGSASHSVGQGLTVTATPASGQWLTRSSQGSPSWAITFPGRLSLLCDYPSKATILLGRHIFALPADYFWPHRRLEVLQPMSTYFGNTDLDIYQARCNMDATAVPATGKGQG